MGADGEVVIGERLAFSMLNGPWDPQGVVVFANGSDSNRHRLTVVPGAGHLFEEEGTLQDALAAACDWFRIHLGDAHD